MDRKTARLREIGIAISRERVKQGLTQNELSHMIGLTNHSHLSRIESGKKAASLNTIFDIADALGKDVKYFFTEI